MATPLESAFIHYDLWLAQAIGDSPAKFLTKLQSWEPKAANIFDGVHWVYKSLKEWATELNLSVSGVRHVIKKLLDLKLIQKEKKKAKQWKQVCFYRCIPKAIAELKELFFKTLTNRDVFNQQLEVAKTSKSSISTFKTDNSHSQNEETSQREHISNISKIKNNEGGNTTPSPQTFNKDSKKSSCRSIDFQEDPDSADILFKKNKFIGDKGFYEFLVSRAKQFGKKDPPSWASVVLANPEPAIVQEYQDFCQRSTTSTGLPVEISALPLLPPPPNQSKPETTPAEHLARLVAKWVNFPQLRQQVQTDISANPKWGLTCDSVLGPALAAGSAEPGLILEFTALASAHNESLGILELTAEFSKDIEISDPHEVLEDLFQEDFTTPCEDSQYQTDSNLKLEPSQFDCLSSSEVVAGESAKIAMAISEMIQNWEMSLHENPLQEGVEGTSVAGFDLDNASMLTLDDSAVEVLSATCKSAFSDCPEYSQPLPAEVCLPIPPVNQLAEAQQCLGVMKEFGGGGRFPVLLRNEMIEIPFLDRQVDSGDGDAQSHPEVLTSDEELTYSKVGLKVQIPQSEEGVLCNVLSEIYNLATFLGWDETDLANWLKQFFSKSELTDLDDLEIIAFHNLLEDLAYSSKKTGHGISNSKSKILQ